MGRRRLWTLAVLGAAAVVAVGQLEDVRDLAFGNKPFNVTDQGLVMRSRLMDNDAGNPWDVLFTRIAVENLGTAQPAEIEWVEVRLDIEGQVTVLARGKGFPITEVLLGRPAEERCVPDDKTAYLTVWIKVTDRIREGNTVQPKIRLWWSEGDQGGTIDLVDGVPEKFVVEGSFAAQGLPGPEGGVLNPGDVFVVAEAAVWDTEDVNFTNLYVVGVRVDGPRELIWTVDINNGATRIEVPAGLDFRLPEPAFAAFDEAKGPILLWVTVPQNFLPKDPVAVAPTFTLTLKEGPQEMTFRFSDPVADTVVAAGLEVVKLAVPEEGRVLTTVPGSLVYSTLDLADQDRNHTPVRLDALELVPLGTVADQIRGVELMDGRGNFIGLATGLSPLPLLGPDGKPILLLDDRSIALTTTLLLAEKIPLGGSLLLSHRLTVEEVLPREFLYLPTALTKFQGMHSVSPAKAVFFGQPRISLRAVGTLVETSTDGETVGIFAGILKYTPASPVPVQSVSAKLVAEAPYRIAEERLSWDAGELAFRVETGRTGARAGKLVSAQLELVPSRFLEPTVLVTVDLRVARLVDWARIDLPYTVSPGRASLALTMPKLELKATKDKIDLSVDTGVAALTGVWRYDPALPLELAEITALKGYQVKILETKPGAITFRVELAPRESAAAGVLVSARFKAKAETKAKVTLEVREVLDAAGKKTAWALKEDSVEVVAGP